MDELFPAIIASTHKYFQLNRTQIIYKKETVLEVVKQINQYKVDGIPLRVFLHPPTKKNTAKAQIPLLRSLIASKKEVQNAVIGYVRACDVKQEDDETKAFAIIDLTFPEAREAIKKHKDKLCFILQIVPGDQANPNKSFQTPGTISSILQKTSDERASQIKYIVPPIKVLHLHIGLKNSVTNPYIKIL